MRERHDAIVIGGGQAGLAMSYHLRQRGIEHIILERKRVAERWHSERWKSLRFQFPNYGLNLPGFEYQGSDPHGFAHYLEIARFIEDYAAFIAAPVRCGTEVTSLSHASDSSRFLIDTDRAGFEAARIVIATGPFQRPLIPQCATKLPASIFQVHASRYVSPAQLPPGAVLVVGSGASGCQISEDLREDGRRVYLSISRHRRSPRRYRGHDLFWWSQPLGRLDQRIDSFPERKQPPSVVVTGANGGYDIDVRRFAADGVIVLGRLRDAAGSRLSFAGDAEEILRGADEAFIGIRKAIDDYVRIANVEVPEEKAVDGATSARAIEPILELDLKANNITSVVWSTGYDFDYEWLKIPVLNARGAPKQDRGVTDCPNLYFLGLHWMHKFKSGLLFGVGEDATFIAGHMKGEALD